jgi:hypothetical protein
MSSNPVVKVERTVAVAVAVTMAAVVTAAVVTAAVAVTTAAVAMAAGNSSCQWQWRQW